MSQERGTRLAFSRVTADGASPTKWMVLLHGVFGMGGNLRTLARRVAERHPRWGFVLPDLRGHGRSQGLPPPHTVAAAAADVAALEEELGHPIHALGGHSFGGKVALSRLAAEGPALESFVLLDSMPGARPERLLEDQAGRVLSLLEGMPWPLPSRARFLELVLAAGVVRAQADWLAMNVQRDGEGFVLRLDLPAIRAMLTDYFALDLWPELAASPPSVRTLVVVGGRSTLFGAEDRARLGELAEQNPRLEVRVLAQAGHWLHVDDLEGLVDLLARHLEPGPV